MAVSADTCIAGRVSKTVGRGETGASPTGGRASCLAGFGVGIVWSASAPLKPRRWRSCRRGVGGTRESSPFPASLPQPSLQVLPSSNQERRDVHGRQAPHSAVVEAVPLLGLGEPPLHPDAPRAHRLLESQSVSVALHALAGLGVEGTAEQAALGAHGAGRCHRAGLAGCGPGSIHRLRMGFVGPAQPEHVALRTRRDVAFTVIRAYRLFEEPRGRVPLKQRAAYARTPARSTTNPLSGTTLTSMATSRASSRRQSIRVG